MMQYHRSFISNDNPFEGGSGGSKRRKLGDSHGDEQRLTHKINDRKLNNSRRKNTYKRSHKDDEGTMRLLRAHQHRKQRSARAQMGTIHTYRRRNKVVV